MAALLISIACAEKSPAEEPVANKSSGMESSSENSPAQDYESELSSEKAYERVMREIRDIEKSPLAKREPIKAIEKIEGKFRAFIEEYPGSKESHDAMFQLGVLYNHLQKPEKAILHLEKYLSSASDADENKVAFAHYSIAEAYKNAGNFDAAKKHYRIVVDRYASVNTQLLGMARTNLEDMDVIQRLAIGKEPIPFEVTDLNGSSLSLEKYKGKVVLLDFWATWCAPCLQEMPNVKRIYKQYHQQGFEIIGISLDSNRNALEKYVRRNDIKWPQHFDGKAWNNEVAKKYKVRSIPATFLLDRSGKIRYKSVRGSRLAQAVEKLVKEK